MSTLIYCVTCGKQISSTARSCPNCGHVRASGLDKTFVNIILTIILVAVILGIGFIVIRISQQPSQERIDTEIRSPE